MSKIIPIMAISILRSVQVSDFLKKRIIYFFKETKDDKGKERADKLCKTSRHADGCFQTKATSNKREFRQLIRSNSLNSIQSASDVIKVP